MVPAGTRVPILRGPLTGSTWYAGAAAGEGKGLSPCFNLCETEQLKLAAELSRGAGVCFDIGANVGLYSLLFARNARRVFSFEPVPRNLAWLQRTIAANKLMNVTIIPAAVSSKLEIASFQQGNNCAMGKLSDIGDMPALCVSVDDIVEKLGAIPDLVKIDVEGGELAVLRGAEQTLRRRAPKILLSTHGPTLKAACLEYLGSLGYLRVEPLDSPQYETAAEFCVCA
jgi:FkbM family methyltransferase